MGTRDDADLTDSCPCRSLTVNDDILPEMVLPGRIVVRDVYHRFKLSLRNHILDHLADTVHHQFPVGQRELHAVLHLVPVASALIGLHRKERQTIVRIRLGEPHSVQPLRQTAVVVADQLPKIAGTGMDHYPKPAIFILLKLDEVVAAAKGAYLLQGGFVLILDDSHRVYVKALRHQGLVLRGLMPVHPQRNPLADATHNAFPQDLSRDVLDTYIGLHSTHSAADVNSHGVRNHNSLRGEHSPDRHPYPGVHVRHKRQMVEHERKRRKVVDLPVCYRVKNLSPNLDRSVIDQKLVHSH